MNEERLKELERRMEGLDMGLGRKDALALINRIRELVRALEQAVDYLKQGKIKFAPTTTNSFVDDFISKWEKGK